MSRDAGQFGPTDPRTTDTPAGEAQPPSYWLRSSSVPDVSPKESTADGASGISRGPGVPTRPDQMSSAPAQLFLDSPPSPTMTPPGRNPEPTTQAETPTYVSPELYSLPVSQEFASLRRLVYMYFIVVMRSRPLFLCMLRTTNPSFDSI